MLPLNHFATTPKYLIDRALHLFRSCKQVTIFVEGKSDEKFWGKFIEPKKCRTVVLEGKENVLESSYLVESYGNRFPDLKRNGPFALALVDLDYDHLYSNLTQRDGLKYIQFCEETDSCRDAEVLILRSVALYDFLLQFGLHDQTEEIRKKLFESGSKIGALRYIAANPQSKGSPFGNMGNLDLGQFFDSKTLEVNSENLIEYLSNPEPNVRRGFSKQQAETYISEISRITLDFKQSELCRGHDLVEMLTLHLRQLLPGKTFSVGLVDSMLRLSFNLQHLKKEKIYKDIENWGKSHGKEVMKYSDELK